jgi:hypothetical protein
MIAVDVSDLCGLEFALRANSSSFSRKSPPRRHVSVRLALVVQLPQDFLKSV